MAKILQETSDAVLLETGDFLLLDEVAGGTVYTMTCTPASFTFTGQTDGNYKTLKMLCTPATYAFTGMISVLTKITAPVVYLMTCTPAVFTLVGKSVTGWWKSLYSSLTQDTKSSSTLTQDDKH